MNYINKFYRDIEVGEAISGFQISDSKENPMQTSKLYSEIQDAIDNAIKKKPDYNLPNEEEAIESIEQLLLDKMEGLAEFIDKNNYSMLAGKWDSWSRNATNSDSPKTTKELIEIYLNK